MKPAAFYYLPAILFIALTACGLFNDPADDPVIDEDLLGVVWKADSLLTPDGRIVPEGLADQMTIEFGEDLTVSGQATGNVNYEGIYEIIPLGSISIQIQAVTVGDTSTLDPGAIQNPLIDALGKVTTYLVDEDRLQLHDDSLEYVIHLGLGLIEGALLGVYWKADSLKTPDGEWVIGFSTITTPDTIFDYYLVGPPRNMHFSLQFHEDLRITGEATCNRFNGAYKIARHGLMDIETHPLFGNVCRLMSIEEHFLGALDTVTAYQLDGRTLSLFDDHRELVLDLSIRLVDEDVVDVVWNIDSVQTPEAKIVVFGLDSIMTVLNGDTLVIRKYIGPSYLLFRRDMTGEASIGCNDIFIWYEIKEHESILVGSGKLTGLGCWDIVYQDPRDPEDIFYLEVIDRMTRYEIGPGRLSLSDDQRRYVISCSRE